MKYKKNWEATQEKWKNYWKQQNTGRPLMCVIARKPVIEQYSDGKPAEGGCMDVICQGKYYNLPEELKWKNMEDKYQNAERIVARYRQFCETHEFMGESFPNLDVDFGPGSLASYLGSEIGFKEDTVWFEPCIDDWEEASEFVFDPEKKWFKKHMELVEKCRELAGDDFLVDMPDLMENIDVLVSLRGAQDMLYDMIDEPEMVEERIKQITNVYFEYYDRFQNVIKDENGGNAYTVFQIWGPEERSNYNVILLPCCHRTISVTLYRNHCVSRQKKWIRYYIIWMVRIASATWMRLWRLMKLMLFSGQAAMQDRMEH